MGEGDVEARGELCVGDEAGGVVWAAVRAVLQALRQPAVPAARASRKSRRCMGGTFSKGGCQSIEHLLRRQGRRSERAAHLSGRRREAEAIAVRSKPAPLIWQRRLLPREGEKGRMIRHRGVADGV